MRVNNLKQEFKACALIKVFEFPVINKADNSEDWITFDIDVIKNSLVAQHPPLTEKEERSKFIANKKLALDSCFSLDEHLQELHGICRDALANSDFYTQCGEC